jgi:predicted metalloprotease with PDZ domain
VAFFAEQEYSLARFAHVLAHEQFHHWLGEKIAPKVEAPMFWFTEGFTDYYAHLLNYHLGLISYEEFVDEIDNAVYKYYSSGKINAHEEEMERLFNKDAEITKVTTGKGTLIASEWNLAIRRHSDGKQSLDDFMRRLFDLTYKRRMALSNELVTSALAEFLGDEAKALMQNQVMAGGHMQPSPGAVGDCSHLDVMEMAAFQIGYDMTGSEQNIKVVPGSNAELAGLRDGQEILDKRFIGWMPWHLVELKVRDHDGTRWIRYLPQRRQASIWLPMYNINDDAYKLKCPNF